MNTKFLMVGAAMLTMLPVAAEAAIVVNYEQVGANVVATTTGTFDITGLKEFNKAPHLIGTNGIDYLASGGTAKAPIISIYTGFVSNPTEIGSGTKFILASSSNGDPFGFNTVSQLIALSSSFVSGGSVEGTATFNDTTLAALGLTTGTYNFKTSADTVTINIGNVGGAVPEPATWAMMLLGFGATGAMMRRRKASTGPRIRFA